MATLRSFRKQNHGSTLLGDAMVGAVSGLAGVFALDKVADFMYRHENPQAKVQEEKVHAELGGSEVGPTSIGARQISQKLNLQLNQQQQEKLSMGLHYALGILPGMLYGMLLGRNPKFGFGRGLAYGLTLFLVNDEILSVKLGWTARPSKYPWQAHARGLAAHLALGLVTYAGFQALERVLLRR